MKCINKEIKKLILDTTNKYDICFVFFTDFATDARTINLARTYVKHGYKVCVIAGGTESEADEFAAEGIKLFTVQIKGEKRFIAKWVLFNRLANKYSLDAKADIYFGMDLYSLYFASKLATEYNSKLIYDSREIYSALGPLAQNKFKQKVLAFHEKQMLKNVSKILVSGELDAEYLKSYFRKKLPFEVIMNLPPYKDHIKSDYLRDEFNISKDKIILIYQGMLLPGRGLVPVIRSLPLIEEAVLVIYGDGYYKYTLKKEAHHLNIEDRVIFAGVAKYDELHHITSSADIGLVFIEPISFSYNLALPNKLFEYGMAGIPSLISNLPAMKKIADEYPFGTLLDYDASPIDIASALRQIYKNRDIFEDSRQNLSKIFSYENQSQKILNLLNFI